MAAAFDLARLSCGDWDRERFWNWKGRAEVELEADLGVGARSEVALEPATDSGVVKDNGDVLGLELVFNMLLGVEGEAMRFAFRDVRSGEGVCGAYCRFCCGI